MEVCCKNSIPLYYYYCYQSNFSFIEYFRTVHFLIISKHQRVLFQNSFANPIYLNTENSIFLALKNYCIRSRVEYHTVRHLFIFCCNFSLFKKMKKKT